MSSGRWSMRGWAFQGLVFRPWSLAGGAGVVIPPSILTLVQMQVYADSSVAGQVSMEGAMAMQVSVDNLQAGQTYQDGTQRGQVVQDGFSGSQVQ